MLQKYKNEALYIISTYSFDTSAMFFREIMCNKHIFDIAG